MKTRYEAVVVGTGFGGAVAACRLAQAGLTTVVFERGRRYGDGYDKFPRNWEDPCDGWLWEHGQGLFDVKAMSEMMVVAAAGYGGGSLIYANVHLRMPPDAFARGWPEPYSREALDPYYDLVAYMLDINPIAKTPHGDLPPKTVLMREVAKKLGRAEQFCLPNIAVNFDDPHTKKANKFGVAQRGCNYCGECDIGCNNQSKNTLDLNYLALAERTGNADTALQTAVTKIEQVGSGYRVHYRDLADGVDGTVEADAVFVCAGAVNTTELLLRCRDEHRTLPKLSPALGYRYSGNGDYLAFAFDTAEKFEPSRGPTITTGIVYDRGAGDQRTWFIFQEGGYPKEVACLLQILNPKRDAAYELAAVTMSGLERAGVALARGAIAPLETREGRLDEDAEGSASSAVFLAMGRDLANGRIELLPATNLLRIHWDVPANLPLYSTEERFTNDVAGALGGATGYNPFWRLLHRPVSVHNLGGAVMADHPADGVCDSGGEVFGYSNLFVLDGAALPASTGTNPSHTIAAVAERNVERFIRRYKNDPTWRAPENAAATRIEEPLDRISVPREGTPTPLTPSIGITFTETMKGLLSRTTTLPASPAEYAARASAGEAENGAAQFTLTITVPDVDAFMTDKNHGAIAAGKVRATGLTEEGGAPVVAGVFNLFVEADSMYARKMLYALPFYGADGQPYLLSGVKDVRDHGTFDIWPSTSTLYTVIRRGHDQDGPVVAAGVLHILERDFARQLTTLRTIGGGSALAQADAMARFGRLFLGTLFDVFVRPRLEL